MDYKKVRRMKRKSIIAPKPTITERMPRRMGRNKYKPTNAPKKTVPHAQKPKITKAIFTTNFMLIGR
jgi:hypothetical protein